jgi:phospholipid/cholesterol/gamma-HCH transport system ATP-binding protein
MLDADATRVAPAVMLEPPTTAPRTGLVVDDVSFRFGDIVVLDDESLTVEPGETLVVTGENGVGKSTLLYLCAGLLAAASGVVLLDGQRPDVVHPSALVRAGVRRGFVFQQGGLLSNLSAFANVVLALRYHADVLGLDDAAVDRRARDALARVDVARADMHALPAHLSFGVRKRVAVARALALDPNFMFVDDPDAGLDPDSARLVSDLLVACRDDPRVTLVVVTNHRGLLDRLEVRPYELSGGKLLHRASRFVA